MESNKLYQSNTEAIDKANDGLAIPSRIKDFTIKYISTDGWRGYFTAKASKKSGWEVYDGKTAGWVTGNWSDAGSNASDAVEDELDVIAKQAQEAGREMIVVFLPSSNVFSTVYDVFTRPINK